MTMIGRQAAKRAVANTLRVSGFDVIEFKNHIRIRHPDHTRRHIIFAENSYTMSQLKDNFIDMAGDPTDMLYYEFNTDYREPIYPETYVHIDTLKEWVRNVKLRNEPNYNKRLSDVEKENLVDSIAYKIARKIYYVGVRPKTMTDEEWDKATKHMRPPKGTFHKKTDARKENKDSNKFKYTKNWTYTSQVGGISDKEWARMRSVVKKSMISEEGYESKYFLPHSDLLSRRKALRKRKKQEFNLGLKVYDDRYKYRADGTY